MFQRTLFSALLFGWCCFPILGQSVGKIASRVNNGSADDSVVGATIVIDGTQLGTVTDPRGEYFIVGVPVGSHTVKASPVGFEPVAYNGVVVNSGRTRELNFQLVERIEALQEVVVEYTRPLIERDAIGVPRVLSGSEIENLLDVDNVRSVYSATGSPSEDGWRSTGNGHDFFARQEIPETARALYGFVLNNPSNYGIPRLLRLGMRMNFQVRQNAGPELN